MKKENDNQRYIADLIDQLAAEKLSIIDFDRHRRWLSEMAAMLKAHEQEVEQLKLICGIDDIVARRAINAAVARQTQN